jgi:hypothetical protein
MEVNMVSWRSGRAPQNPLAAQVLADLDFVMTLIVIGGGQRAQPCYTCAITCPPDNHLGGIPRLHLNVRGQLSIRRTGPLRRAHHPRLPQTGS